MNVDPITITHRQIERLTAELDEIEVQRWSLRRDIGRARRELDRLYATGGWPPPSKAMHESRLMEANSWLRPGPYLADYVGGRGGFREYLVAEAWSRS